MKSENQTVASIIKNTNNNIRLTQSSSNDVINNNVKNLIDSLKEISERLVNAENKVTTQNTTIQSLEIQLAKAKKSKEK